MSLIPSFFGSSRSNILDPFSLEIWDPFKDFPFSTESQFVKEASALVDTRVDWKETPEAHVFKADLPGLNKEEVKVEVEDDRVLQISGERKVEKEEKKDTWHRVERSSGKFLRRFRLPENAKMDQIKASMENGVLTVTVPKMSLIPSFFGSSRSNISDPFSLEVWDPFKDFPFSSESQFAKENSALVNTRVDWKETRAAHVEVKKPDVKSIEISG
ncbi:18.2 kda class i heat shock protein [Quercus suber]|uniref:18.2 kDa class i heat shock protein n=1 Tax=Quercus suber TaxID=58331 RepID=A0AAW0LDE6_QUESU